MKIKVKNILPYFLTSICVVGLWKFITWTDNYAWFPKDKELSLLNVALNSIFYYKTIFWLVVANLTVFAFRQLLRENYKTTIFTAVSTTLFYILIGEVVDNKCAYHYYSVFQNQSVTEPYLKEPIASAGYHIGSILTEKIEDKEMKFRVHAMLGLQNLKYEPATEVMTKILLDDSENVIYRANAYEFLKTIQTYSTKQVINEYQTFATDSIKKEVVRLGEYFYSSN